MNKYTALPMSLSELADAYQVSNKVMKKWLSPHESLIGQRVGLLCNPKQVLIIYECLGYPPNISNQNQG